MKFSDFDNAGLADIQPVSTSDLMVALRERRGLVRDDAERKAIDAKIAALAAYAKTSTAAFGDANIILNTGDIDAIIYGSVIIRTEKPAGFGDGFYIPAPNEVFLDIEQQRTQRAYLTRRMAEDESDRRTGYWKIKEMKRRESEAKKHAPKNDAGAAKTNFTAKPDGSDKPAAEKPENKTPFPSAPADWLERIKTQLATSLAGNRILDFAKANGITILFDEDLTKSDATIATMGVSLTGRDTVVIGFPAIDAWLDGMEWAQLRGARTLAHELDHQELDKRIPELTEKKPHEIGSDLIANKLREISAFIRHNICSLEMIQQIDWENAPANGGAKSLIGARVRMLDKPFLAALSDYESANGKIGKEPLTKQALGELCVRSYFHYIGMSKEVFSQQLTYDLAHIDYKLLASVRDGTWPDVVANHPLLSDAMFAKLLDGWNVAPSTVQNVAAHARRRFAEIDVSAFKDIFSPPPLANRFHASSNPLYQLFERLLNEHPDTWQGTGVSTTAIITGKDAAASQQSWILYELRNVIHTALHSSDDSHHVQHIFAQCLSETNIPDAAKAFLKTAFTDAVKVKWEKRAASRLATEGVKLCGEWNAAVSEVTECDEALHGMIGYMREQTTHYHTMLKRLDFGVDVLNAISNVSHHNKMIAAQRKNWIDDHERRTTDIAERIALFTDYQARLQAIETKFDTLAGFTGYPVHTTPIRMMRYGTGNYDNIGITSLLSNPKTFASTLGHEYINKQERALGHPALHWYYRLTSPAWRKQEQTLTSFKAGLADIQADAAALQTDEPAKLGYRSSAATTKTITGLRQDLVDADSKLAEGLAGIEARDTEYKQNFLKHEQLSAERFLELADGKAAIVLLSPAQEELFQAIATGQPYSEALLAAASDETAIQRSVERMIAAKTPLDSYLQEAWAFSRELSDLKMTLPLADAQAEIASLSELSLAEHELGKMRQRMGGVADRIDGLKRTSRRLKAPKLAWQ